ncbi:MAG: S41 family peptidase, partial [Minisyncoccales bacterium]
NNLFLIFNYGKLYKSMISQRLKKTFVLICLSIFIFGVFGLGIWLGRIQVVCPVCPPEDVDLSLLWQAWKTIEEKYAVKEKINAQEMLYGAVNGLIKSLDDPYTVFLKPEDAKKFLEDVKGTFEGVGMEIAIRDGQLRVVAPLADTPAQRVGLRPGDKILQIDGKSTEGITIDEAINWIRGPKGTEVTLTIYRDEWGEARDIKLIRDVIDVPAFKLEIRDDKIAYLKIYQFSERASYEFPEIAFKILNSDVQKIILDLRSNPGGYLEVAQEIASWFLQKGQVVAIEDFDGRQEQKFYLAKDNAKLISYPLVVLINNGSASGAEILAGALRDNRGIKLIGEKSFGKGSVQELVELKNNSFLKITIANWLTPKGELINNKGLEPDIKVEMTAADYEAGRDPQLEKAIEIIKEIR